MYYKIVRLAALFVFVMLLSCSVEKDFTFEVEMEFEVDYGSTSYSIVDDIDVTDYSSDFDEYKDDIESVTLEEATYTVTSFTGPLTQVITLAELKVGETSGATPTVLATLENVNISSVSAIETEISTESDGEDKLVELVKDSPHQFRCYFVGTANEAPVDFDILFKVKLKVKYKKSAF
ncbi:hypothetical protein JXI42_00020 [bacterium]|nr:hypothetical protein [bacterium]